MNKILISIAIIIMVGMLWWVFTSNAKNNLVSPKFSKTSSKSTPTPQPSLAPPNAPKTFQFDETTDLNAELEKVNPQILDSDFE